MFDIVGHLYLVEFYLNQYKWNQEMMDITPYLKAELKNTFYFSERQ